MWCGRHTGEVRIVRAIHYNHYSSTHPRVHMPHIVQTPTSTHMCLQTPTKSPKLTQIHPVFFLCQQNYHDRLTQILEDFPKLDDIHPFYADLMNVLYDRDHYKLALGQISTARNLIDNVAKDYTRLLKFGDSLYRCKQLKVRTSGVFWFGVERELRECAAWRGRCAFGAWLWRWGNALRGGEQCECLCGPALGRFVPGRLQFSKHKAMGQTCQAAKPQREGR